MSPIKEYFQKIDQLIQEMEKTIEEDASDQVFSLLDDMIELCSTYSYISLFFKMQGINVRFYRSSIFEHFTNKKIIKVRDYNFTRRFFVDNVVLEVPALTKSDFPIKPYTIVERRAFLESLKRERLDIEESIKYCYPNEIDRL